jgi:hypothetical protein
MGLNYIIIFYLYIYIWLANTLIRRTEQTKIEKAMLNWSLRTPDHKQEAIFPVNHNSNLSPPVTGKIKFGTCNSGVPAQASVPFKWLLRDTMHRRAVPKSFKWNHLGGDPVVRAWDQEVCSLCGFRFEPCDCSYNGYWRLTWSLTSGPVGLVEMHGSWPEHPC